MYPNSVEADGVVASALPPTNGSVISTSPEQPKKALSPIFVTESGTDIALIPVQFTNAPLPIVFTPSPMVTYTNFVQLANARSSISPVVTCKVVSTLLSIEAAAIAGIVALVICAQPVNASSPIDVRFFDKVTEVRLTQSLNALAPILVTVSGITSVCMAVLPLNASSLIATTVPLL